MQALSTLLSAVHQNLDEDVGFGLQRLVFGAGYEVGRKVVSAAVCELELAVDEHRIEQVFELMDKCADIGLFEKEDAAQGCETMLATLQDLKREWPVNRVVAGHRIARFPVDEA